MRTLVGDDEFVCRFFFTCRKLTWRCGFIPLPVEIQSCGGQPAPSRSSLTEFTPVRGAVAGAQLGTEGQSSSGIRYKSSAH
jgi:hypothetical protein